MAERSTTRGRGRTRRETTNETNELHETLGAILARLNALEHVGRPSTSATPSPDEHAMALPGPIATCSLYSQSAPPAVPAPAHVLPLPGGEASVPASNASTIGESAANLSSAPDVTERLIGALSVLSKLESPEENTPSRTLRPRIKKDDLYIQGLWSQKLVYLLRKNELEIHSANFSVIQRAVNTEEEEERLMTQTTTVTTTTEKSAILICAPQTPCAWSVYKPIAKIIEMNIVNSYCKCSSDTSCQISEEDLEMHAFVLRCRPLNEEGAATAES